MKTPLQLPTILLLSVLPILILSQNIPQNCPEADDIDIMLECTAGSIALQQLSQTSYLGCHDNNPIFFQYCNTPAGDTWTIGGGICADPSNPGTITSIEDWLVTNLDCEESCEGLDCIDWLTSFECGSFTIRVLPSDNNTYLYDYEGISSAPSVTPDDLEWSTDPDEIIEIMRDFIIQSSGAVSCDDLSFCNTSFDRISAPIIRATRLCPTDGLKLEFVDAPNAIGGLSFEWTVFEGGAAIFTSSESSFELSEYVLPIDVALKVTDERCFSQTILSIGVNTELMCNESCEGLDCIDWLTSFECGGFTIRVLPSDNNTYLYDYEGISSAPSVTPDNLEWSTDPDEIIEIMRDFIIQSSGAVSCDDLSFCNTSFDRISPPIIRATRLCPTDDLKLEFVDAPNSIGDLSFEWTVFEGGTAIFTSSESSFELSEYVLPIDVSLKVTDERCFSQTILGIGVNTELMCNELESVCAEFEIEHSWESNSPTSTENLCYGSNVSFFSNLVGPITSPITYSWTGPNGFSSTHQNPEIMDFDFDNVGLYTIEITHENCTIETSFNLEVNIFERLPNAGIARPFEACNNVRSVIDLTDDIIDRQNSGGSWTRISGTGGIFNATSGTFTVTPDASTSEFRYDISNNCGSDSQVSSVVVNQCFELSPDSRLRLRFMDPCSCTNPKNCDFGGQTLFHDTLIVFTGGVSGLTLQIAPGATDFYTQVPCSSGLATPTIVPGGTIIPETPAGSGSYKLEFWRPGEIFPNISVTDSGTSTTVAVPAATFLPLCSCGEPIPTLSQWGLIWLSLLLLIFGVNSIIQKDLIVVK